MQFINKTTFVSFRNNQKEKGNKHKFRLLGTSPTRIKILLNYRNKFSFSGKQEEILRYSPKATPGSNRMIIMAFIFFLRRKMGVGDRN